MGTSHQKQWDFLIGKLESGRLSHAYLISGAEGVGKKEFVHRFLKHIECNFPDVMMVSRKEGKDEIEISQIREVQNFLSYAPYHGKFKAVVVDGAEYMNQEAQNCFLKTLEEPKGKTLIFLISSKPEMLLPTIFSRCQQMVFHRTKAVGMEDIGELRNILNGTLAQKFAFAKEVESSGKNVLALLKQMERYLRHLMLVDIGASAQGGPALGGEKQYSLPQLKKNLLLIEDISRKLTFTNASQRLALEIVLMEL